MGVGVLFLLAVVATPAGLIDIENLDTLAQRYAAVAEHDGKYRLVNVLLGAATLLAFLGVGHLAAGRRGHEPLEIAALAAGSVAAAAWLTEAALRATLVVDRARDLVAEQANSGTALTDQLIAGDGVLVIPALLAMASIAVLALRWRRQGHFGRPTAAALIIGSLAGAVFVRSDPFANMFVPYFPFVIGFLPAGIIILRRIRLTVRHLHRGDAELLNVDPSNATRPT